MRHIRITLEDKEAELLDDVRKIDNRTYRDLLLAHIQPKKKKR